MVADPPNAHNIQGEAPDRSAETRVRSRRMSDAETSESPNLLEQAWALGLQAQGGNAKKRDEALRLAIAAFDKEHFQLGAVALLVQLLLDAKHNAGVAEACEKLADAYIRRGDLPGATAASHDADRAEGDGPEIRRAIAKAFGKGSKRAKDVSQTPPPLPSPAPPDAALLALSGDALLQRATKALGLFVAAKDPLAHGDVPALPLFSSLEPRALERLLTAFVPRHLAFEEMAIEQNEEGREAFIVVRGLLRAERTAHGLEEETPTLLAQLGPGAIFGEMALVSDAPRAASVTAQEPATILAASREALEAIATNEPVIGKELGAFCRSRMIANLVRTSPLLRAIPSSERETLMALFVARTFAEGEALVVQGEEPTGLFLLASGGVRVTTEDPNDGEPLVVADLGPGDVVGEISVVLRRPASATVVASFPTVALELVRAQFHDAIRQHPLVLAELYALATARDEELRTVVAQQALDVEEVVLV
jgi:cAMP-dependent protein kinase regulator